MPDVTPVATTTLPFMTAPKTLQFAGRQADHRPALASTALSWLRRAIGRRSSGQMDRVLNRRNLLIRQSEDCSGEFG
jgi:hypothetical protein